MQLMLGLALWLAAAEPPGDDEDVLGELVVEATELKGKPLVLMKLGVEPVIADERDAGRIEEVLRRDLDLSGQFVLVKPAAAPAAADAIGAPLDENAWGSVKLDAVVRVRARRRGGDLEIAATVFFDENREQAAFERTIVAPLSKFRTSTHKLVDKVIGALTGYDGPFVSKLVFVRTLGKQRTVFTIDPDGHGAKGISPKEHLAVGPAIGPDDAIYYAASVNHSSYKVYRAGEKTPLTLDPSGSVYGLAFSQDRQKVAVSIAVGSAVQVFTGGADFSGLRRASKLPLALHPTFSPKGDLAVAGSTKLKQRIYAAGKAVSIPGATASAPDYCRHPDGTKLVYTVGFRRTADVIVASPKGGNATRITRGSGRNSYPACSPDGRLIAFFSTRKSGDGPGLYVMRVDGHHVRKISSMMGDSLRWARVDPDRAR